MKSLSLAAYIAVFFLGVPSGHAMGHQPESAQKSAQPSVEVQAPRQADLPGAAETESPEALPLVRPLPVYLSELANINDYSLFANAGWDGNWYVGYNVCWMEKLPAPPAGEYRRAFIGARLGRMKTRPAPGKPVWEKEPIPGDVYLSLSSTPAWKSNQKYFLTSSQDIPLDGDLENAPEGVGEARWFWTEVPLEKVNLAGENYLALWSPTPYFISTASSPILAGGWGGQDLNTWMSNDMRGYPPIKPDESLKTGITVFEPAIVMKLIPAGTEQDLRVTIVDVRDGRKKTQNKAFFVSVQGDAVDRAWLEVSTDGLEWQKHGRPAYHPPYIMTLSASPLPAGALYVRCGASDIWENTGYSEPVEISVVKEIPTGQNQAQ